MRAMLMSDFETTTNPEDCRVWAWGMYDIINDQWVTHGTDIDSFIHFCEQESTVIYFHNLQFDDAFILDWLLNHGYVWTNAQRMREGEFSTLISGQGKHYSITVKWCSGARTEFRDSLKKINAPVARIAQAYGFEMSKGEIDYDLPREPGHELTPEEFDYLKRDIVIVGKALKAQFDQNMTKLTSGADSLYDFKTMFGKKQFETFFPILELDIDSEIRKAYRGGWTYVNPKYRMRRCGSGRVFDVNSLYPSVMYDRVLPYGEPRYFPDGPCIEAGWELWIASITFTAELKENHLPCIQVKGAPYFVDTEYQETIVDPITMVITNVDYALWNDQYALNVISWNGCYMFQGSSGFFKEYIDKWITVKNTETGVLKELAKLHLNSLYGKFATNPDITGKRPVLNDKGVIEFKTLPQELRDPVYTPMGVFITAYAREVTIRAAQENYDVFAYADTDSLHLIIDRDPENLDIHPKRLGAWKRELVFFESFYARAKAYQEDSWAPRYHRKHPNQRTRNVHVAGLPWSVAKDVQLTDWKNGKEFGGKLLPKRVPGGMILESTTYTLKLLT